MILSIGPYFNHSGQTGPAGPGCSASPSSRAACPRSSRVGVLITSSNAEWWQHVPTLRTVNVHDARISLPYLKCTRTATIPGDPSVELESYRAQAPFALDAATEAAAERPDFAVPPTTSC